LTAVSANQATVIRHRGRFDATLSNDELYTVVALVAVAVSPSDPSRLTQRGFDTGRGGVKGAEDAPTARAISMRLKKSWAAIVETAIDPERDIRQTDVAATRSKPTTTDEEGIYFALRLVHRHALASGSSDHASSAEAADADAAASNETLSRDEYIVEREQLLTDAAKRGADALAYLEEVLPTISVIEQFAGDFTSALEIAGLTKPANSRPTGLSVNDALDLYYSETGKGAGRRELRRFTKASGLALTAIPTGTNFDDLIASWEQSRREHGLPVPTEYVRTPRSDGPVLTTSNPSLPATTSGERGYWTLERVLEAVIRYDDSLPVTKRRTQTGYRNWVRKQPKGTAPWPRHFDQYGGFTAVLEKAKDEKAARAKAATNAESPTADAA
jgi:hypothetical protein